VRLSQLETRSHSQAHRGALVIAMLDGAKAIDFLKSPMPLIRAGDP